MEELFEKSKKMVEKIECDEELKEALAVACLAIIILKEEQAISKLPEILESLRINYEDKSIKEQEKKRFMPKTNNNYAIIYSETCFKGDTIKEEKTLLVSKNKDYITGLVRDLIQALLKEIRTFSTKYDEDFLEKRTGISVSRIGVNDQEPHITNEALEMALEEYETRLAIEGLYEYLDQKKINSSVIEAIYKERDAKYLQIYSIYVYLVEQIMNDPILIETLLNTKTEKIVKNGLYYYNTMMEDEGAFSRLNRLLNKLKEAIEIKIDEKEIEQCIKMIQNELDIFNSKPKKYRLK